MDRTGTSTGDQGSGTDALCGSGDTQKLEKERMIVRNNIIGGMFFTMIGISSVIGFAATNLPWYLAIPVSIFGGFLAMFFGMGIEWLRCRNNLEEMESKLIVTTMSSAASCRQQIKMAVASAKKECGGFAVESARAVSNRVANRLIARHARNLMESEYREATFDEADKIIEEELKEFQDAIRVEVESDEKK